MVQNYGSACGGSLLVFSGHWTPTTAKPPLSGIRACDVSTAVEFIHCSRCRCRCVEELFLINCLYFIKIKVEKVTRCRPHNCQTQINSSQRQNSGPGLLLSGLLARYEASYEAGDRHTAAPTNKQWTILARSCHGAVTEILCFY